MKDVLVVGSGAGGVHAAWRLAEQGLSVGLIDFGNVDKSYAGLVPDLSWSEIRASRADQHRYFLGDRFEGIPFGQVKVGAQLTPPRKYLQRDVEERLTVDSPQFAATETLARGGLSAAWGAGVFPYDDWDLRHTPLDRAVLQPHYDAVAERIGICGDAENDLTAFQGGCPSMMPALDVDSGAETVLERYAKKRERMNRDGFFLGVARLAVSTEEHRGRGPHRYLDMDFWADDKESVYRPQWTLDELERFESYETLDRRLVRAFREKNGTVEVECEHADTGARETLRARALVLAAGALGSARIALRSLGKFDRSVPILSNPYAYVPVVNTGMIGKEPRDRRHSLAQLTAVYQPDPTSGHVALAHYYSYRSLMTFKLLGESPLGHRQSLRLFQTLLPAMGILGIHHEDRPTSGKTCTLRRTRDGDSLEVRYQSNPEDERREKIEEKKLVSFFRKLGCFAPKRIHPGHGASIRYAGTLPFSENDEELTCDADCRLRGTQSVYLADGAVFPFMPPKGITFTIMANADRVGARLAERLA